MTGSPEQSLVSVIVPVHNGEQHLAEALDSIFRQSYKHFEVIVINDGSNDASSQVIARYPEVSTIEQSNEGVTRARNNGIKASNGELVAFLDQDDRWLEDTLSIQVHHHIEEPDIQYTLGQQICFLDGLTEIPGWFKNQQLETPHTGYLPGTLMVKRELFDTLGMFDPDYPISSDADWFARAKDAGIKNHVIQDVLLERRIHADNQSGQVTTIHTELFKLLKKSINRKNSG